MVSLSLSDPAGGIDPIQDRFKKQESGSHMLVRQPRGDDGGGQGVPALTQQRYRLGRAGPLSLNGHHISPGRAAFSSAGLG